MRSHSAFIVLAILGAASFPAMAGPRDSGSYTNRDSDGIGCGGAPDVGYITITGSYKVRYIRITGQLQALKAGTFGVEAALRVDPNLAGARMMVVAPCPEVAYGTVSVDAFVPVQPVAASAGAPWQVLTFETSDDGAGADARWNNLTVTLNDGPPASFVNFGPLAVGSVSRTQVLAANQLHWYKLELQADVSGALGTYLDIDTEGSAVGNGGNNDAEIALYNSDGLVAGYDDDDGGGYMSQLSFGAGTRPSVGGGWPYDGRDGALPAGTYYLVARGFGAANPSVGWDFANAGSTKAGSLVVNIRTNTGTPLFCAADFNKSGTSDVSDIFAFLTAWFAGCP